MGIAVIKIVMLEVLLVTQSQNNQNVGMAGHIINPIFVYPQLKTHCGRLAFSISLPTLIRALSKSCPSHIVQLEPQAHDIRESGLACQPTYNNLASVNERKIICSPSY